MRTMNFSVLLVIFLACSLRISCRAQSIRKYTQLDGYTASRGYDINQDEKGYIWLGTDNGGLRFDGNQFEVVQDTRSAPDAEILHCIPVGEGRIVLLPIASGISYKQNGKWIANSADSVLGKVRRERNRCFLDAVTGIWWLGNDLDLNNNDPDRKDLVSFKNRVIQRHRDRDTIPFFFMQVIDHHFIGNIAYPNSTWLAEFDHNTKKYAWLTDSTGTRIGGEQLMASGSNTKYMATYILGGQLVKAYAYQPGSTILKLIRSIPISCTQQEQLPNVSIDRNNGLWIKRYGENGITYYGNIENMKDGPSAPVVFLQSAIINSVFVDHSNNVWLSSPDNALYFLSYQHFKNTVWVNRFQDRETPQSISGSNGVICISHYQSGVLQFIKGSVIRKTRPNKHLIEGARKIIPLDSNRFIIFDRGICIADASTLQVSLLTADDLYKDLYVHQGKVYAAGVAGARAFDIDSKKSTALFTGRTTAIAVLSGGNILIGTPSGLHIKSKAIAQTLKPEHSILAESYITGILPTGNNTALVSTNAQGLFQVFEGGRIVRRLKTPGNISLENIRSLYKQDDHTVWAATNKGAFSLTFDQHQNVIRQNAYTYYDGLPSNNVTGIYVSGDTAYFATTQGLGIIPLKPANTTNTAPRVYIDKLLADTTTFFDPDSFVSLSPAQNSLKFRLSAISFESLGKVQYHYKLSPLQNNWETTVNPEIRFIKLPPGTYQLTVYATSAKGINSPAQTLHFNIEAAFWQTTLSKLILTVLALILLLFSFRLILKRGERKRMESLQQKKRLAELELEAIKAQINPHFIYNCLTSIKYLNYTGSYQLTEQYLSLFAKLIRTTMQYSRRTFVTVDEEIGYLSNYLQLEKLRFKEKLDYFFEMDIEGSTLIPAMLLQPYVENALKHGIAHKKSGGKVWIVIRKQAEQVEITIRDNGSGFSNNETQDAMGIGLSMTRATTYNELFHTGIRVTHDNVPDTREPGAIIKITFKPIIHEQAIQQRRYH